MILYLDTIALLKRYFQEPYSDEVLSKWKQAEAVVRKIVRAFQRDWSGFIQVEVTNDLNEYIYKVLQNHSLRGFDAIHLASALVIYEKLPQNFFFACFDRRLNQAARTEGLESF